MSTSIDICICTFRRPQLIDTLRSVAELNVPPDWKVRVIVADNDDTPSARERATATAASLGLDLTYVHAPARNISVARNACLKTAMADWIAFIDDDATASPGWLKHLMEASVGADAVLGPVRAIYPPDAPGWIRNGNFHATMPVIRNGEIQTGYTCNVLIRQQTRDRLGLDFAPELGRTGGEDTLFFYRLHQAGGKISFAPEAVVHEKAPPDRCNLSWLYRRRFRSGQTHALLIFSAEDSFPGRCLKFALAAAKWGYCLLRYCLAAPDRQRRNFWLLRSAVHLGVMSGLLRHKSPELYGT